MMTKRKIVWIILTTLVFGNGIAWVIVNKDVTQLNKDTTQHNKDAIQLNKDATQPDKDANEDGGQTSKDADLPLLRVKDSVEIVEDVKEFTAAPDDIDKLSNPQPVLEPATENTSQSQVTAAKTKGNNPSTLTATHIERAIDVAVEKILKCHPKLPAMTVGVVKDGKVFHNKAYGLSDPVRGIHADSKTIFGIASITKSFAAILALQTLHDRGLSRDTRIVDILGPEFRYHSDLLTQQMTIGDLLSHRTGISSHNFLRFQKHYNRRAIVRDMAYLKAIAPYRDSFLYSNIGYGLLAYITEKLHGGNKTWEDLVTQKIFQPLGMTRSYLRSQEITPAPVNVSVPHYTTPGGRFQNVSDDILKHWGRIGASGSVMTTALDMTKWMHVIMNKGVSMDGRQIISPEVIATAIQPRVPSTYTRFPIRPHLPVTAILDGYASGLMTGYYRVESGAPCLAGSQHSCHMTSTCEGTNAMPATVCGHTDELRGYPSVAHSGGTMGYTALVTMIPSMNVGVFLATNGYDRGLKARFPLTAYILDVAMGEEPWLNSTTLCTSESPEYWSGAKRSNPSQKVVGKQGMNHTESEFLKSSEIVNETMKETTLRIEKGSISSAKTARNTTVNISVGSEKQSDIDISSVGNGVVISGRNLNEYVGIYGTVVFGNLTISLGLGERDKPNKQKVGPTNNGDDSPVRNGTLTLTYGVLEGTLYPREQLDVFYLQGTGSTWFYESHVEFRVVNGTVVSIFVQSFDSKSKPVLYKIT